MPEKTDSRAMLLSFLRIANVGVLATIKPGNIAHGTTIYYYVDDEFNFYFLTKNNTIKVKNIESNNSVSLVVNDADLLQTVQVDGVASDVKDVAEYEEVISRYNQTLAKNRQQWDKIPLSHIPGEGNFSLMKITPSWIRWTDYRAWEHLVKYEHQFS